MVSLRADDVHHRRVDAGRLHRSRARCVEQRRVDRDLQMREIALEPFDHRVVALVADLVAAVRAAGQQEALQILRSHQLAHLAVEHLRGGRRDHRLEDLRLAVVAVERAGAGGDGERREGVLAAALQGSV